MIRLFFFFAAILALGLGFAWFADRPGDVSLVWQGTRYETSLMVVVVSVTALVAAVMFTWWTISTILRSPQLMRRFFRNRRRDRGYYALSHGLLAASSGDVATARRLTKESRKLLGSEALVDLLEVQTSLLEGNREAARDRLETMLEDDDTKLAGLHGLYLEADREGAHEAARHFAEQANEKQPSLVWASAAMLKYRSAEGDWVGAQRTLENLRSAGGSDKARSDRLRAVLLTGQAMAELAATPDKASKTAQAALKLAGDLSPAAVIASDALVRLNDPRRAARVLEDCWKKNPHPETAAAYVYLKAGETAADRLERAKKLKALAPDSTDAELALAEAAILARDWQTARHSLEAVMHARPTQRACMMMADLEEGESGDKGRTRHWLSAALRAPRDALWMDGVFASEKWMPYSPHSGRLDAFEWRSPPALLGAPILHPAEDEAQEETPLAVAEMNGDGVITVTEVSADAQPETASADANGEAREARPALGVDRLPDDPGVDPREREDKQGFRLF